MANLFTSLCDKRVKSFKAELDCRFVYFEKVTSSSICLKTAAVTPVAMQFLLI